MLALFWWFPAIITKGSSWKYQSKSKSSCGICQINKLLGGLGFFFVVFVCHQLKPGYRKLVVNCKLFNVYSTVLLHLHILRGSKYVNCCWGKEPISMKKQKSEWLQINTLNCLLRRFCKIHFDLFFFFTASWLLCMWHQKRLIMMLLK